MTIRQMGPTPKAPSEGSAAPRKYPHTTRPSVYLHHAHAAGITEAMLQSVIAYCDGCQRQVAVRLPVTAQDLQAEEEVGWTPAKTLEAARVWRARTGKWPTKRDCCTPNGLPSMSIIYKHFASMEGFYAALDHAENSLAIPEESPHAD